MKKHKGFTIVELLIVIVVIAILAAITIVAYNGIQASARDATRKQHLSDIAKALQIYYVDHGNYVEAGSGCGLYGNGNGYLNYSDNSSQYPKSILQCLNDDGLLNDSIIDPSGCVSNNCTNGLAAYMKYTCSAGTFLYAHLERETKTPTEVSSTITHCQSTANMETYRMNYIVKVN